MELTVEQIKVESRYARTWSEKTHNLDDWDRINFLLREVDRLKGVVASVKAVVAAYEAGVKK